MAARGKDLREQLQDVGAKLRESRSLIRPISQVTVRLKHVPGRDQYATTIDNVLKWMNKRAGRRLPAEAWSRQSFELSEIGAQRLAAAALDAPRYWAARLDDADKEVTLRTWVTEVGVLLDDNGDVLFGTRLICASRGDDSPFDRTLPGFVRPIVMASQAILDDQVLTSDPRLLTTAEHVDELVRLLERPSRENDVVVFSLSENSNELISAAASVYEVHRHTLGAVHIFALSGPASYLLTDRVGKELSVFRAAVRSYKPGFVAWLDEPSRHPLALADRIAAWPDGGPKAFEKWLTNQILASSVHGTNREERLPSFTTVRQLISQRELERAKNSGESTGTMLKLYEEDNLRLSGELREQREQYDGRLRDKEVEREAAIEDANFAKSQNFSLRERIRHLEKYLAESSRGTPSPVPTTIFGFEEWCKANLVGSVEVVNRAFQGARKSEYHDPTLLYKALLVLRDYYVPMRIQGGDQSKEAYEDALGRSGLEETATGEGARSDQDQYSVQYGSTRRRLDRHLKLGSSREPRFCFRLYFFWDDEAQQVVVGWLPSHLDNRLS